MDNPKISIYKNYLVLAVNGFAVDLVAYVLMKGAISKNFWLKHSKMN